MLQHHIRKYMLFVAGWGILFFLSACSDEQPATLAEIEAYPTTQPIVIDTTYLREYVADLQSPKHVELRSRVKGFLEKIHVDEGQEVQQGQLLFSLSNQEFQEELRKAQAVLTSAKAEAKVDEVELQNTRLLVEKNVVSKSELAMAEARHEVLLAKIQEAASDVSAASLNLTFSQVRAPYSGIINRIPRKQGSLIEEGELLTTLSSNHDIFAYFNVSEKEYLDLEQEESAEWKENASLLLANGQLHPFPGKVETAETVINKNTGNIAFRTRFSNPGHRLRHGASGKVLIRRQLKDVMIIPEKSIFDVQDKTYVYILDEDNIIRRRSIVLQRNLGHLSIVASGLSTEDRLIYEGIQQVRVGEKVSPDLKSLSDIMSSMAMR